MKAYEDLNPMLKARIEEICSEDPYDLKPTTLYRNIYNSTGSTNQLATTFDVSPSLVEDIKDN